MEGFSLLMLNHRLRLKKTLFVFSIKSASKEFSPNVWCAYHSEVVGHHTNRCWQLKYMIQNLIDESVLQVEDVANKP